jgi:hypothetical protein
MIVNDKYEWLWPVLRNRAIIYLQELSTVTNSASIMVDFPTQVSIPSRSEYGQERQCAYKVTLRRVRVTTVAMEKQ